MTARVYSIMFAIGLIVLWIAGLNTSNSSTWLTWLDGGAGLVGFGVAFGGANLANRVTRISGPVGLAIALFAMWIIGMATNGMPWQNWWTFAFGCGYFIVGMMSAGRGEAERLPVEEEEQDRFRRAA